MAIGALGGVDSTSTQTQQNATVNQEDLFRILLTQLNYQDPLKPIDNAEFISQLAQFTSLEQARQTNENIQSLMKIDAANQAIGIISRTVEVTTETSRELGSVVSVNFDSGSPVITVQTSDGRYLTDIPISQVQTVGD
ncbi:flagellar hook capping FlgD N-terminal domain-containing protein [Microbulbifer sp. SAOS-129_SWC]|uniref:flagellar hook assembly protein FlgD n=1 Tax=Microbulbifer sp. SAOS-129_SWC TaxID=3145235 RepID=UPI003216419B